MQWTWKISYVFWRTFVPLMLLDKLLKKNRKRVIGKKTTYILNYNSGLKGFTDNKLLSVKPCMLFFIQTFSCILCAGAISCVSLLDLFGPITGATNPTTQHFCGEWWTVSEFYGPRIVILGTVYFVTLANNLFSYCHFHMQPLFFFFSFF